MANYIESDREFALKLQEEEESLGLSIANDSLLASQLQCQYDEETRRSSSPSDTRSSHELQEDLIDYMDLHVEEMPRSSNTRRNLRSHNRSSRNRRPEYQLFETLLGGGISFFQGPHHFDDFDSDEDTYETLLELGENVGEAVPKGLKSHEINALPVSTFNSNTNNAPRRYSVQQEDHCCAICLSEFEENERLRTLPCLHRFHVECIDRWIKTNGVCPTCRVEIKEQLEIGS